MWLTHTNQSPVNLNHVKTILKKADRYTTESRRVYEIAFPDTGIHWSFETENERDEEYRLIMKRLNTPNVVIPHTMHMGG